MVQLRTGTGRGPVLSDGTPVGDLIDLDRHEVSLRLLVDPEVYELELEHLFGRAWIVVGHESEVPEPGDYVTRRIGADPVVVVRREDGSIEVLLNVCTHRGMQVCRAEVGNATKFRCPYHGWVFGDDGRFLAAPFEREMYGDVLEKASLGLQRARVGTHGGIVFACWDDSAPSLADFLGDFAWYLDTLVARTDRGVEVAGSPQRFIMRANWKTASEQFAGDGYHGFTLHRSLMELNMRPGGNQRDPQAVGQFSVDVSSVQGHGLRCMDKRVLAPMLFDEQFAGLSPMERLQLAPPPGLPEHLVPELANNLDPRQIEMMAYWPPTVGGMFPNVGLLAFPVFLPSGGTGAAFGLHTFVPLGVDSFEFMHWNFIERGSTNEEKRFANEVSTYGLGVSGMWEQDDAEAWPAMQTSARGFMGRRHTLKYQALLGVNRRDDWAGGGLVYDGFSKDDNQWNWWLRYRDYLTGAC